MDENIFVIKDLKTEKNDIKLNGFNLTVKRSETILFASPLNAGSLLFDTLYLENRSFTGSLNYFNDDLSLYGENDRDEYRSRDISFVDLKKTLFDNFSVMDNILIPSVLNRVSIPSEYLDKLLETMNISHLADRDVKELSNYEYLLVKTARSMSSNPFTLLVYDVFKELNGEEKEKYSLILNRLNDILKTTILVESEDITLSKYASRTYLIDEGNLIDYEN